METDLLTNVRGNVQSLRNMWTTKVQEEQKLKPRATVYRSQQPTTTPGRKQSIKIEIQSPQSVDETTIVNKKPTVTFEDAG